MMMYQPDKKVLDMIAAMDMRQYFLFFASSMNSKDHIEELTGLFSEKPYMEKEINGDIWRQLRPREKRFDRIDLVYTREGRMKCVRWFSSYELSSLIDIFGKPSLASSFPGQGEMTAFIFPGNSEHLVIASMMPEYIDEDILDTNPAFNPKLLYLEFRFSDPGRDDDAGESLLSSGNPVTVFN
jgi:hypothetical protein